MNEELFCILKHAFETVPFYRNLSEEKGITIQELNCVEQFSRIPFVNKSVIQENREKFISEQYLRYPYNKRLSIRRTSGSTGQFLKIYWDDQDNVKSLLELWYNRKRFYNIHPHDKYCYFYTTDYRRNKLIEESEFVVSYDNRSIGFSKNDLDEQKLVKICHRIFDFAPKYLLIQPSIAILLIECMETFSLPKWKELQYIELTGELLLPSVRKRIENFFECKICNQYGCNEANCIASEHNDEKLHIHNSNVYVEVIKDGESLPYGEYGDIYITSLSNYAMPFIRYKISDQGRILLDGGNQILELTKGRVNEYIIDENNNKLPFYILLRPIEYINEQIGQVINQFQVVQNGINDFTVYLALRQSYIGWKETIINMFISNIKQASLENAKWEFRIQNYLFPERSTGKLAFFYNKMNGGNKHDEEWNNK